MIQIVLDVSANTFKNNWGYFEQMVQQIKTIDSGKYNIVFKTQLFSRHSEAAKINIPLDHEVYEEMNRICGDYNYSLTSSVFDNISLDFLLHFSEDTPFIKIACRSDLYNLIENIPSNIIVYVSIDCRKTISDALHKSITNNRTLRVLKCIPEYPANTKDYIDNIFKIPGYIYSNISDHTANLKLFKYWESSIAHMGEAGFHFPFEYEIFEMHYVLKHDDTNPDAGAFAKTIKDLTEIL